MTRLRILLASVLLTVPIAALARAPWTPPASSDAVLRFSWRMSVSARENCRLRTQDELDALPVHMRAPEVCTRDTSDYRLVVAVDGVRADTIHLVRGGLKGDRPLFVLEERRLPPGDHSVRVALLRTTDDAVRVIADLDTALVLEPGAVGLVTLDGDADRLVVRVPR